MGSWRSSHPKYAACLDLLCWPALTHTTGQCWLAEKSQQITHCWCVRVCLHYARGLTLCQTVKGMCKLCRTPAV
jgi:hypothetical protein